MNNYKFSNALFIIVFVLSFIGFYAIILSIFQIGLSGFTRQVSIPVRMLIGFCCALIFFKNYSNRAPSIKWFILFAIIYLLRIMVDYSLHRYFYISYLDLVFYFVSFCILPFVSLIKLDYKSIDFFKVYKWFLFSALLFNVFTFSLYSQYIGSVGRLSSGSVGEDVISPLILSYCGALIIGVCSMFLLFNRRYISKSMKLLSLVMVIVGVIPFFLGASRGSVFAIVIPFLLLGISRFEIKRSFIYLFTVILFSMLFVYIDSYLGSGLVERISGTSEAIEKGTSSASRIDIWLTSLNQFADYPIFGDKLATETIDIYPHNIFIESMQSIGIFGFIPVLFLAIRGLKSCFYIIKYNIALSWITVFYIQALMQSMFSGALYTAAWFWTALAVVLGIEFSFTRFRIGGYKEI